MRFDAAIYQSLPPTVKEIHRTYLFNVTLLRRQADSDLKGAGVGGGTARRRRAGGCLSRYDAGGRQSGEDSECELHCLYVNE
jgi:hypothetical protein